MELCYEELLSSPEHIGQYGKIVKVSASQWIEKLNLGCKSPSLQGAEYMLCPSQSLPADLCQQDRPIRILSS